MVNDPIISQIGMSLTQDGGFGVSLEQAHSDICFIGGVSKRSAFRPTTKLAGV